MEKRWRTSFLKCYQPDSFDNCPTTVNLQIMLGHREATMKKLATCVFVLVLAWISVACAQQGEVADAVYTNGRIYTVNEAQPWAEAVASSRVRVKMIGRRIGSLGQRRIQLRGTVAARVGSGGVHRALAQAVGMRARVEERDRSPATWHERRLTGGFDHEVQVRPVRFSAVAAECDRVALIYHLSEGYHASVLCDVEVTPMGTVVMGDHDKFLLARDSCAIHVALFHRTDLAGPGRNENGTDGHLEVVSILTGPAGLVRRPRCRAVSVDHPVPGPDLVGEYVE